MLIVLEFLENKLAELKAASQESGVTLQPETLSKQIAEFEKAIQLLKSLQLAQKIKRQPRDHEHIFIEKNPCKQQSPI